jgi:hypothetical protein
MQNLQRFNILIPFLIPFSEYFHKRVTYAVFWTFYENENCTNTCDIAIRTFVSSFLKISVLLVFFLGTVLPLLTYLLTELSPSWGAVNCAAPQEPPRSLWNPKFQYRVHKSPPLVPILSHINPIHSIPSYLSKMHFNIVHPPTSWSS